MPGGQVFRSADRVVLVLDVPEQPGGRAVELPSPPEQLVARPPHSWTFERIR